LSALKGAEDFVSGEDLGKMIGASRAAVWKHIKQLRAEGIQIDSVQNRGYRISGETDSLNPILLPSEAMDDLGYDINYFLEIGSTNVKAQELAREGCPHGTIVLSEVQKTGKGRLSRQWLSPNGGLWMSIVLRPKISPAQAPFVTLLAGCALASAIQDMDVKARIKWPNDILIGGKKVCGILTEMDAEMQMVNHIIIGIGMNVNNPLSKFPNGLRDTVTTLKEETGKKVDRPKLLLGILGSLKTNLELMETSQGRKKVLERWRKLSDTLGRHVRVEMVDGSVEGTAKDVDEEGALLVETGKGVERVLSGDCVHLKG
jgi:BirA family biotin operon repressor/biotin-[acetyl-CoA-carboxylase] ligase